MKHFGKWAKLFSAVGVIVLAVFAFAGEARGQGKFLYVANQQDNTISAYTIDSATGALTPVKGSPFDTTFLIIGTQLRTGGFSPTGLAVDPAGKFLFVASQCSGIGGTCLPPIPGVPISGNISVFTIDNTPGSLTPGALTPLPTSPFNAGFTPVAVAVDPSGKFLYAVNLNAQQVDSTPSTTGAVSAFTIGVDGALTQVSGSPFPGGLQPVSVAVDPSGKFAYVANFFSHDVSAYSIDSTTGALTSIGDFQAAIAPDSVAVDPSGKLAYVAIATPPYNPVNEVLAFNIDGTTGALTTVGLPVAAGTAPASVAVDPLGGFVFVANVISNNDSVYAINGTTGALTPVPGSPFAAPPLPEPFPFPGGFTTGGPNSVAVDPSGKFAYVVNGYHSNFGPVPSTISVYTIGAGGALTAVAGSPFQAGNSSRSVVIAGQTVVPPAQGITNLMNTVSSLSLASGLTNSLDSDLSGALASLAAGHVKAACNQINLFIQEVEAQSGKKITGAEADQLIAQANAIGTQLGCS